MQERVEIFLNYLSVERGVSAHTLSAYRNDLRQLTEFLLASRVGIRWSEIEEKDLTPYLRDLEERGYSFSEVFAVVAATHGGGDGLVIGFTDAVMVDRDLGCRNGQR